MNGSDATPPGPNEGRGKTSRGALQFRAGGRVLSLFSTTLHGQVLRSLSDGPVSLADLQATAGDPPEKTLRGSIGNLIGLGALEPRRPDGRPAVLDNGLTPLGHELLSVANVIEAWLAAAPSGPLDIDAEAGREAVKALLAGWSSTMLRALVVRPLALAELDGLLKAFSEAALERRLTRMRIAGQIVTVPSPNGGLHAFAITDWLRRAAAPLLTAIRCERLYLATETVPPARIDFETVFLLSLPLLRLPERANGRCQLAVELSDSGGDLAGATVVVERGRIVSCASTLDRGRRPAERAYGDPAAWLEAIALGDLSGLEFGGLEGLSRLLVESLHATLCG